MKSILFLSAPVVLLIFSVSFVFKSPSPPVDEMSCLIIKNENVNDKSEEWKLISFPDKFYPSTVTFGEKGEIVLIGNDIRFSKDNGETWKIITEGKGYDRCTLDGGKTFDKDCDTASEKPQKIKIDDDINYNGNVRSPTLTPDGRLYLSAFYEHHGALWSISLENPKELWFGLHFTYDDMPEDAKYWTTDTFITLKNKVFVSAHSTEDDDYNWLTTDNKGKMWHRAGFNLDSDRFFVDGDNGLRIVENQIEKTTDGGRNWQIVQSPKTPENTFSDAFVDDKNGFASGDKGLLAVTKDGGITWRKIDLGIEETFYIAAALDEKNAWVAGEKGLIFETSDSGETWQNVDLGFEKNIYSSFYGEELKIDKFHRAVWIIKDGKIYRKTVK
jgi:Photosynthesis system II assembly factor YCF48